MSERNELPYGDDEYIVATARGIVTNELMIADLSEQAWQISLALMIDKLADIANLGLILVPRGPHIGLHWINNTAPGCTLSCQLVAAEDVDALNAECDRMFNALHPSPNEENTVSETHEQEYEDIPGIDPRLIDPDEEGEPDDDD